MWNANGIKKVFLKMDFYLFFNSNFLTTWKNLYIGRQENPQRPYGQDVGQYWYTEY